MQTPEDFVRTLGGEIGSTVDDWLDQGEAVHLIRERDAEVRADERAKVLDGFTEERRTLDDGYAGWSGNERGGQAIFRPATRPRRLVGPWEPAP